MGFWDRLFGQKAAAPVQREQAKATPVQAAKATPPAPTQKPDDFAAVYHLGNALYQKGDFSGAIAQYRGAIRLKPDLLEARNNLANTLYSTGDLNAAITEFRELLQLAPNFADAHNNLGSALYDNGDVEAEIREYSEAIRLKPGSDSANIARENLERAALKREVEQLRAIGRLVTDIRTNHRVKGQYVSLGKTSPFKELEGVAQLMDSCANSLERGRDEEGNPTRRSDMAGFLQKLSYLTADGQRSGFRMCRSR